MTKYLFVILFQLLFNSSFAQPTVGGVAGKGFDMNTSVGGTITTMDLTDYSPTGNTYLVNDWITATITLRNYNVLFNVPTRLDLLKNTIEIKDKEFVRAFSIEKSRFIDLKLSEDSTIRYINPLEFTFSDNTPVVGLLRILTTNDGWNLVEHNYLNTIESNYIKALDAGTSHDQYQIRNNWLFMNNNKIYSVTGGKKFIGNNLFLTKEQSTQLTKHIKEKRLSLKKSEDLIEICSYLNTL